MVTFVITGETAKSAAAPVMEFIRGADPDHGWVVDLVASNVEVGWTLSGTYSTDEYGGVEDFVLERTITQDDLDGDEWTFTEVSGALDDETYFVRWLYKDAYDVEVSDPTDIEVTMNISETAPVLSSATAATPAIGGTGSLTGTVSTDTGSGSLFMVASTASNAPTGEQIEAGQMHTGAAAAGSFTGVITATGAQSASVSGLTNSKRYYLHYVQKVGSTYSNVVTANAYTDVTDRYLGKQSTADTASISTTNVNFADVDVGDAHPNKILLVLCVHNGGSAKHDGFAATGLTPVNLFDFSTADDTANANTISGWAIPCPNGGTVAGLQLQLSAAPTRAHGAFYVMDRGTTVTDIVKEFSASAQEVSDTMRVPPYGAAFGIASTTTSTSGTNVCDWTGLPTENYDYNPSGTLHVTGAQYTNPGASDLLNRNMKSTWLTNPSANLRLGVVSFGDHT